MARPKLDAGDVRREVQHLLDLHARTPVGFAEAFADSIMDDEQDEQFYLTQAAFRSPELAQRSLAAADYLIADANRVLELRAAGEGRVFDRELGDWRDMTPGELRARRARTTQFRQRIGLERTLLKDIVRGLLAQRGIQDATPNPRGRAARELQRRHSTEYLRLVRKHEAAIAREREEKKAQQKAARAAKRRGNGTRREPVGGGRQSGSGRPR